MIGTGILSTPGEVAGHLGAASLVFLVWTLGGVYALLCSSSITELATMLPTAGGWYVYSRRAFGDNAGFVVGCGDWVQQAVGNAYLAAALGGFSGALYPGLAEHGRMVAAIGLIFLSVLNWLGLRTGSRAQELTSAAKALGLLALVIACFTISPRSAETVLSLAANSLGGSHALFLGLVLAMQGVIVTYDGWYAPIYFVEEDRDPTRNLPHAMIGTALACTIIFLSVNAGVFHVLHMDRLVEWQNPAADAALLLFGRYGRLFILLLSVVTVISTINAILLQAPRILFGMARDGLLPQRLASVNRGGTPSTALFLCLLASLGLVLAGSFESLIAIASILFVAVYLSGFLSLMVLQKKEPTLARPYKVWWYPWGTLVTILASGLFLIGSVLGDLKHSLFTLILVVLSYVASLVLLRKKAGSVTEGLAVESKSD